MDFSFLNVMIEYLISLPGKIRDFFQSKVIESYVWFISLPIYIKIALISFVAMIAYIIIRWIWQTGYEEITT